MGFGWAEATAVLAAILGVSGMIITSIIKFIPSKNIHLCTQENAIKAFWKHIEQNEIRFEKQITDCTQRIALHSKPFRIAQEKKKSPELKTQKKYCYQQRFTKLR